MRFMELTKLTNRGERFYEVGRSPRTEARRNGDRSPRSDPGHRWEKNHHIPENHGGRKRQCNHAWYMPTMLWGK